jgi:hypothetical protein
MNQQQNWSTKSFWFSSIIKWMLSWVHCSAWKNMNTCFLQLVHVLDKSFKYSWIPNWNRKSFFLN